MVKKVLHGVYRNWFKHMNANKITKKELQWSFCQMARLLDVAAKARGGCTLGQAKGHEPADVLTRGSLSTVSPGWISVAITRT